MSKTIEKIVDATGLSELLKEIDIFCEESYMRADNTECMELVKMVKSKEGVIFMCCLAHICQFAKMGMRL